MDFIIFPQVNRLDLFYENCVALAEYAFVDQSKIVDYLLSMTHPDGQAKARFFVSFGFQPNQWKQLADALRS